MRIVASSLCLDQYTSDSLLLSASCLPLPSQKEYFGRKYKVAESPWLSKNQIDISILEIESYYEQTLQDLMEALNKYHKTTYNIAYWRIVVGPAVYWLLSTVYEKYERFKKLKSHGNFSVISRDVIFDNYPLDTMDLVAKINTDDVFHLYLVNKIAESMGVSINSDGEKIKVCFSDKTENKKLAKLSILNRLFNFIANMASKYSSVILYESGFSSRFVSRLFIRSVGRVSPLFLPDFDLRNSFSNYESRQSIELELSKNQNDFLKIFYVILEKTIPCVFVEAFSKIKKNTLSIRSSYPTRIISATGWYFHESFKLWASECSLNGTELIGIQHGGCYGSSSYLYVEEHEIKITNKYYTWGWKRKDQLKVEVSPAAKLIDRESRLLGKETEKILFISTSGVRYVNQIWDLPEMYLDWSKGLENFFDLLGADDFLNFVYRPHPEDRLQMTQRLLNKHPNLKIDSPDNALLNSIEDSKLVICDNMNTTYIEVLALNKPAIFMWSHELFPVRPDASIFYEDLTRVGILHHTSESAVEFYNKIKDDIQEWWMNDELQQIVTSFCSTFARIIDNPESEWLEILLSKRER